MINPKYESGLEYCIRNTDNELPKNEGSIESIRSQLPQQPNGTNEKNEKNELSAVLLQLPAIPSLLLKMLHPKLFP
jgi:hypothetical protein